MNQEQFLKEKERNIEQLKEVFKYRNFFNQKNNECLQQNLGQIDQGGQFQSDEEIQPKLGILANQNAPNIIFASYFMQIQTVNLLHFTYNRFDKRVKNGEDWFTRYNVSKNFYLAAVIYRSTSDSDRNGHFWGKFEREGLYWKIQNEKVQSSEIDHYYEQQNLHILVYKKVND